MTTIGGIVLVTAVILGVLYFATDVFKEKHGGLTADQAKARCEDSAKDRLKAPTTAIFEFQSVNENDTGNGWDLVGRVSSQNGYGAMVANEFHCFTYSDNARFWFDSDF